MVVTVTMNPAIDKTVEIDRFEHGGLNRIKSVEWDAGGKGINVSKVISVLGGKIVATGFLGETGSEAVEKVLKEYDITSDFIKVEGETRTNMKILENTGEVTELNEPGPVVTEEKMNQLIEKLEGYANEETIFVLAGSIPAKIDKNVYRTIIERVHRKGAKVFLDADGEVFKNALEVKPDIIKPNRIEIEQFYHMDYRASDSELVHMGEKLLEKGVEFVTISLGQMGAIFLTKDKKYECSGLSVKSSSTVGAGDAMVAAIAYGIDNKLPMEEYVKLSIAVSAGAVTTVGTKAPEKQLVDSLLKDVEIHNL